MVWVSSGTGGARVICNHALLRELLGGGQGARLHRGQGCDGGIPAGSQDFGGAERIDDLPSARRPSSHRAICARRSRVGMRTAAAMSDRRAVGGATTLGRGHRPVPRSGCAGRRSASPPLPVRTPAGISAGVAHVAALRKLVRDIVEHTAKNRGMISAIAGPSWQPHGDFMMAARKSGYHVPFRTELLVEPHRRLEPPPGGDVFAEENRRDRAPFPGRYRARPIAVGQFRHARPPSAYTSVHRISAGGGGAALHFSVASSTTRRTSASMPRMVSSDTPNCLSRLR